MAPKEERTVFVLPNEAEEGASMRLGLVASVGTAWLLLKEGLSEFVFAARCHEGAVPTSTTTGLRVQQASCSSGSHEVAHKAMSNTAAKGQRSAEVAMCSGGYVRVEASVQLSAEYREHAESRCTRLES